MRAVRVQDERQGDLGQAHGEAPQQYRGQDSVEAEMQQVQDNLSLGRGIQVANHDLELTPSTFLTDTSNFRVDLCPL